NLLITRNGGDATQIVALIGVETAEHRIRLHCHRREEANAIAAAALIECHHAIIKALGALFGRHLADVHGYRSALRGRRGEVSSRSHRWIRSRVAAASNERDERHQRDGGNSLGQRGTKTALTPRGY